ncbi:MAG: hypothetical protein VX681_14120 [Myxococcota bacterium]|nr:hypothetical protein [Myxococcota bacterium]
MRDTSQRLRACGLGMCALLCALGAGPARAADPLVSPTEVAEHVRELETAIRRARERLLVLVSTPRAKTAPPLHDEPELEQLARELPALERELDHWAQLETGPAKKAQP